MKYSYKGNILKDHSSVNVKKGLKRNRTRKTKTSWKNIIYIISGGIRRLFKAFTKPEGLESHLPQDCNGLPLCVFSLLAQPPYGYLYLLGPRTLLSCRQDDTQNLCHSKRLFSAGHWKNAQVPIYLVKSRCRMSQYPGSLQ